MSSQKGNTRRQRPQKYQNVSAFKNSLHDTSKKTKTINSIQADGCCTRCKEIIEWKIKYKKYKPLTINKKCVRCEQKTVKKAYCMVCQPCAEKYQVCIKCGKNEDIVKPIALTTQEMERNEARLEQELKYLPERKRRSFLRNQGKYGDITVIDGVEAGGSVSDGSVSGDSVTDDAASSRRNVDHQEFDTLSCPNDNKSFDTIPDGLVCDARSCQEDELNEQDITKINSDADLLESTELDENIDNCNKPNCGIDAMKDMTI